MAADRKDVVTLTNVRASFPSYFKKKASVEGGKEKYSGSFLIDPSTKEGKANIEKIEAVVNHIAKATWGDNAAKILKTLEEKRKVLRDGDKATNSEGDLYGGYEGMKYVSASNDRRPKTLNRDKSPAGEDDDVFYGGCYVDAVLSIYTVTGKDKGGNGMFATLEIVRFRKDGEPFGAAPLEEDDYLDDLDDDEEDDGDLV